MYSNNCICNDNLEQHNNNITLLSQSLLIIIAY